MLTETETSRRLIGSCLVFIGESGEEKVDIGVVQLFAIHRDIQRLGCGREMLKMVQRRLKQEGIRRLAVNANGGSEAFY